MGDLKGHALPGSLFYIYGLWWAICALRRWFGCVKAGRRYTATATYGCPCPCGRLGNLPVEAITKIFVAAIGMFGEIIANMPHPSHGIIQHATMYFFFLMSGVVDIAMHCGVPLPPGADYISIMLAFSIEGLLFANHLHGRPPVDVQLHTLLVYIIVLTVLVILMEAKFSSSPLLALSRSYMMMLQGSWFWAAGIILYGHGELKDGVNEEWDMNSHEQVMLTTIYFSWHCAFHLISLFSLTMLMYCCHRSDLRPLTNGNGSIPLTKVNGSADNSYSRLAFTDDPDDSDLEYEKPVERSLLPGSNA